jgi:hypothetical protein
MDYDVGVVSESGVNIPLPEQVTSLMHGHMKNRILLTFLGAILAFVMLISLIVPVAALDPHEDPDSITPEYSLVSFLLFSSEYLDYLISAETFDTDVYLNLLSTANLPPDLASATAGLISNSNSFTAANFELRELMSQAQMYLTVGQFEQLKDTVNQAQDVNNDLLTNLDVISGQTLGIDDTNSFKESKSGSDITRISELVIDRFKVLREYLDQQTSISEIYLQDAAELAGLGLPVLGLKVLPDNAFVGDHIGFQGDLTVDGKPLVSRRISIQSDGMNVATIFTNGEGHYEGTLQIPERYLKRIMLQATYIPVASDLTKHLPALSEEVPVYLRYHSVNLNPSLDPVAYPGRDFNLGLELDYAEAPPLPDRLVEIYLDDDLVSTSRVDLHSSEIPISIDPQKKLGPHLVTIVLPASGRYAPANRVELLEIQRSPLTLELERPTLAYLPGTVRYRGRVTSENGPVSEAAVTLKMGASKVSTTTNTNGGFGAEFDINIAGGLVGRQPLSVVVIPDDPWDQRLNETRHQVVVNLVNCILLGFILLVVGVYLPTRINFGVMRRTRVTYIKDPTPEVNDAAQMPELKLPDKSPPKAIPERVVYWYRRTLFLIQRLTGMSPRTHQTLREFAVSVNRTLGPLGRPFLDLTRLVERLTYSPYRATEADADFGESLARRIDESAATAGPGGEDAGA